MSDLFEKCDAFWKRMRRTTSSDEEFQSLRSLFFRKYPVANCLPRIQMDGREMLQVATNDYLGLAMHPETIQAAMEVVQLYGAGTPLGARPLTGTTELHERLERDMARFRGTEDCVVFNLGLGAMSGTISALVDRNERVFVDAYAHSCVHEGAKLAKGEATWFQHNDMNELESQLKACPSNMPKLIAVDGVYGMSGDLAPLPELVELKNKYGARLLVDDAHGTGVLGEHGRGTAEHFGVEDQVDLHAGTFAKAFGTFGGYVAGPHRVMEYLRYVSPGFVLTKALPAVLTAATIKSLELMQRLPERRVQLCENLNTLRQGLREAGFEIGNPQGAVTSIFTRELRALRAVRLLQDEYNILANAVMYPAVPQRVSIVRITVSALHTADDMRRVVEALKEIDQRFPLQQSIASLLSSGGIG
ncbi:MAG: pyridoxal phosphate-dependent aminotransferase family protein [Pirellulaceae bacterium]|nr:pyridoxal phosphate-dependent aminotransferase family protein [Pirellulaceae bacterium]